MKTLLLIAGLSLLAAAVQADPYGMAIQQARRANDQNNAEQQQIATQEANGGSGPAAPGTPAPSPVLAATLQNISRLQTDLVALINSTPNQPDPGQKIALMNDLSAAAQGAKATSGSIKELAGDLITALAGQHKLLAQKLPLARELHAIFNSSHLTTAQEQAVNDHLRDSLIQAGVPLGAATDVVTDLKTIAGETK